MDTSITAEEAHARHAHDRLDKPFILILVRFVHKGLRLVVTVEVIADKIVVTVLENGADEGRETALITKRAFLNGFEDFAQIRIDLVLAVVVRMSEVFDVLGQITEEEDVALADLTSDFNLRSVSI